MRIIRERLMKGRLLGYLWAKITHYCLTKSWKIISFIGYNSYKLVLP